MDKILTIHDYYYGPRLGIAEWSGVPHIYEAEYYHSTEEHGQYFLSPYRTTAFSDRVRGLEYLTSMGGSTRTKSGTRWTPRRIAYRFRAKPSGEEVHRGSFADRSEKSGLSESGFQRRYHSRLLATRSFDSLV